MRRLLSFSILCMAALVGCDSGGGGGGGEQPPPPVPTPQVSPVPAEGDERFMGLAGNCIQGEPTKDKLLHDDKVLNSLAELAFAHGGARAKRLTDALRKGAWNCDNASE